MQIFPLSESALTVEFGNEISFEFNDKAIALASNLRENPFPGMIEAVSAYSSVTIFYDLATTKKQQFPTAFETVKQHVIGVMDNIDSNLSSEHRVVEISVNFDSKYSLDLASICEFSGLDPNEVIDIFLSKTYRVYMLGFLPGFAYMGEVDERIAAPRLATPRTKVPKGSVGIAGKQTGIYPFESPGGWQIIGRTDVEMFTPHKKMPCLLRPGDEIRFVCDN